MRLCQLEIAYELPIVTEMRCTIQRPDLGKVLAESEKDIERAVTSGMRDAANGLKQDILENVVAAGLGERLSRTWREKTFPEAGESAEAAAYLWSRARKIVDAFDRGVVIRQISKETTGAVCSWRSTPSPHRPAPAPP